MYRLREDCSIENLVGSSSKIMSFATSGIRDISERQSNRFLTMLFPTNHRRFRRNLEKIDNVTT